MWSVRSASILLPRSVGIGSIWSLVRPSVGSFGECKLNAIPKISALVFLALAKMIAEGARMIDEKPRNGAHGTLIAFVHPKSSHGVLTELCQGGH